MTKFVSNDNFYFWVNYPFKGIVHTFQKYFNNLLTLVPIQTCICMTSAKHKIYF